MHHGKSHWDLDGGIPLVQAGDHVKYEVTIQNLGRNSNEFQAISNVVFNEEIPADLILKKINGIELDKLRENISENEFIISGNTVECRIAKKTPIEIQKERTITFEYEVSRKLGKEVLNSGKIIPNTATLKKYTDERKNPYNVNINSIAKIKLTPIDANIKKTVKYVNGSGVNEETPLVKIGDYVTYSVVISNPGKDKPKDSIAYKLNVVEDIPNYLKLVSVDEQSVNVGNSKSYECAPITSIDVKKEKEILFEYLVTNEVPRNVETTIENTAKLITIENRNGCVYVLNKPDHAKIRVYPIETVDPGSVAIKKYVLKCEHNDGVDWQNRSGMSEYLKSLNPYYAEEGDRITFRIDITNTSSVELSNIGFEDYYNPAQLEFISAKIYPRRYVRSSDFSYYGSNGRIVGNVSVPYNVPRREYYEEEDEEGNVHRKSRLVYEPGVRYYEYALDSGDTLVFDLVFEIKNMNINNLSIKNTAKITNAISIYGSGVNISGESSDYIKEKIYNVVAKKYISAYDATVMTDNINKGFIDRSVELDDYYLGNLISYINDRKKMTKNEKLNDPFAVEENETVTYTLRINNNSTDSTVQNTYAKISGINDILAEGLMFNKIESVTKNGEELKYSINQSSNSFSLNLRDTILGPKEYIEITYTAKIISSNMNLNILENKFDITEIKNRNNINISPSLNVGKTTDSEYVKLKEVVVSGYVWKDKDKNGYKHNEPGIENVQVTLKNVNPFTIENYYYGTLKESKSPYYDMIVYTDKNGLYTFGRVKRLGPDNEYNTNMYIEYQYDGLKYQSTLYSADSNIKDYDKYKTDSNASEFNEDRINLNDSLKTIAYNNAISSDNIDKKLNYYKIGTISEIVGLDDTDINLYSAFSKNLIKAYSFVKKDKMNGSFSENNLNLLYLSNPNDTSYKTDYLKNINLGLIQRDQLDLEIKEELDNVTTTVFGDTVTYTNINNTAIGNGVQNEFSYYKSDYYYKYTDYKIDEVQNYLGAESELTTRITYKSTISYKGITDPNVNVGVNEIAVYFDKKFAFDPEPDENSLVKTYKIKETGKEDVFEDNEYGYIEAYYYDLNNKKIDLNVYNYNYKKYESLSTEGDNDLSAEEDYSAVFVRADEDNPILIPPGIEGKDQIDIYFTFTEYNRSDKTYQPEKHNFKTDLGKYIHVLEINAYSTFYKNNDNFYKTNPMGYEDKLEIEGNGAGYVDIDSNPGNIGLTSKENSENYKNYKYNKYYNNFFRDDAFYEAFAEDDTCKSKITLNVGDDGNPGNPDDPGNPPGDPSDPDNPDDPGDPDNPPQLIRSIKGFVFDDCRSDILGNQYQYTGDGFFEDQKSKNEYAKRNIFKDESKDLKISGVTVDLYKTIKIKTKTNENETRYYQINMNDINQYKKSNEEDYYSTTTIKSDKNGEYELNGFTPGNYFVRFSYGNENNNEMLIFNGQDYKSTTLAKNDEYIYLEKEENQVNSIEARYQNRDDIIKYITEDTANGSNAIDDPKRRLEVNQYSAEVNNIKNEILSSAFKVNLITNINDIEKNTGYFNYDIEKIKNNESLYRNLASDLFIPNTKMFADSIGFYIKTENEEYNKDKLKLNYTSRKKYDLEHLNFGLQYRPETQLNLKQYIKEIKLVSSAGKEVLDLIYKEDRSIDEDKSIGLTNVQQLPSTYKYKYRTIGFGHSGDKGFKYVNIEDELLHGCKIYITYGIYIDNIGEIDRIGNALYKNDSDDNGNELPITKQIYLENLQTAIKEYKDEYDTSGIYRTSNRKISEYNKYLGNVYYFGKDADKDKVVLTKIDSVVNDIDESLNFDSDKYGEQWDYYDNIQDLIDKGAYYNKDYYNINETIITSKNNIFVEDIIKNYLKVYNEYDVKYGNKAFEVWYKDLKNCLIETAKNEQIITETDYTAYGNNFNSIKSAFANEKYKKYKMLLNALSDLQDSDVESIKIELGGDRDSISEELNEFYKLLVTKYDKEYISRYFDDKKTGPSIGIQKVGSRELNSKFEDSSETNTTYTLTQPNFELHKKIVNSSNNDNDNDDYNVNVYFSNEIEENNETKTRVELEVVAQQTFSSDLLEHTDLKFDTSAEILSYTTTNGRITNYASCGNGAMEEPDEDSTTETIILASPTGLNQNQQNIKKLRVNIIYIIIAGIVIFILGKNKLKRTVLRYTKKL